MEHSTKIESAAAITNAQLRGSNQSGMRAHNERLVLTLIRQAGPMAKSQIARETGLSAQTVSVIMRALEADGLLIRGEPVRGKIGQPSVPMSLASDGAYFLGLKVGRRSLELVLIDFLGVVQNRVRDSHPYSTPENTIEFANKAIAELLGKLPEQYHDRIAGLGIAMPFQLWDWADTLSEGTAKVQDWQDRNIADELAQTWGFPVFDCNYASAACGAELVFGDQNKPADFLYFYVGFFIGGGLVLNNSLYTGHNGNAAALGSMIVMGDDGSPHLLADVASLATLESARKQDGHLSPVTWERPVSWDIAQESLDVWMTNAAKGIAQAIMSSICLIDVRHVLIDGWLPAQMRADLVNLVQIEVAKQPDNGVQKPDVHEGSIGSDARLLGAASLPLSRRYLVERNTYPEGLKK